MKKSEIAAQKAWLVEYAANLLKVSAHIGKRTTATIPHHMCPLTDVPAGTLITGGIVLALVNSGVDDLCPFVD